MDRKIVNPWTWQEKLDFVHANDVTGAQRVIYIAGQVSCDEDGNPLYPGDLEAQINKAFDNLETILKQAGAQLSDVVRLNYYTTDVPGFHSAGPVVGKRLKQGNCKPVSTLLGVASLAHPDYLIEIEATAVL
ncbi:MAG: RidA family protein [Desulfitobacteriia bacterium]|jgi:enamine deaminase RidA (YjgF/YER057c/UK114 family)